ncbi:inorganic pyrophosphatase-like [Actinia tenebrosa]|uniref:Inorganic pyrophosphatase n=1 Tax=Actinia tenebrosa TaxID=6105 RepID=A0A6P8HE66_ACTTE|nr:inorganic pyrophosphatase-like [Actinia tenebrosa]
MLRSKGLALVGAVWKSRIFIKTVNNTFNPRFLSSLASTMAYSLRESGAPNTLDYRIYFCSDGHAISPFHDVPLFANDEKTLLNMVVEVPRWTNAKMEINTKEALNPIKQDVKKGKLRYVNHCFPYHGYIWNYGAFPQTWEDPSHKDEDTGCLGDNDPIDVCDIGTLAAKRGDIKQVKVLGILAMIDEGETDWKVIVIDVNDPKAKDMNDIGDVEKHMPGLLKATVDWFKIYKVPTGKPENTFAFDGEAKDKQFAMKIINETHDYWKQLIMEKTGNKGGLACKTVTMTDSPYKMAQEDADAIMNKTPPVDPAQPVAEEADRWHFVTRS